MVILKIIGILLIIVLITLTWYLHDKVTPMYIANFIKNNPAKSAIYYVRNDTVFADQNSDKLMPLASTVKIIIAIEYAQQAAKGKINPKEMIDTATIAKFYIPNTDGDAHPKWLENISQKSLITASKVSLENIAKGMIVYSSNANTEYLMDKLGLDNINQNLITLGLTKHQKLYPIVSALLVFKDKNKAQLEKMTLDEYIAETYSIHEQLKNDGGKLRDSFQNIGLDLQKIWSDRLPNATAKEYVSVLKKINSRTYFDQVTQENLDILMEGILENPKNREWLVHAGMKGGSTAFVLTKAMYATTKKGDKTEIAYFFNDLNISEAIFLQINMNKFELLILTNEQERNTLINIINHK